MMDDEPTNDYEPLHPDRLTWAVLLGRWTDFARSAVALPQSGEGQRMRDSVADVITLQAVWFSLQHLDELSPAQRRVGLDRAGVLIERSAAAISARYPEGLPALMADLVDDARASLAQAGSGQ